MNGHSRPPDVLRLTEMLLARPLPADDGRRSGRGLAGPQGNTSAGPGITRVWAEAGGRWPGPTTTAAVGAEEVLHLPQAGRRAVSLMSVPPPPRASSASVTAPGTRVSLFHRPVPVAPSGGGKGPGRGRSWRARSYGGLDWVVPAFGLPAARCRRRVASGRPGAHVSPNL